MLGGRAKCTESRKIFAEPLPGTRSTPPAVQQSFYVIQHIYPILSSGRVKSPIADNEHTAMYSPLPPPGEFYRVQHIYPILFGLMYVARMLKEALQRNAIQIWLRLETNYEKSTGKRKKLGKKMNN